MFEEIYRESRQRTVGLAMGLSSEDLARTVPACPEWTVHLLLAHLAGVAADFAAGRVEGAPGAEWTARHIAERADVPVLDLLEQWNADGDRLTKIPTQMAMDALAHEADLRALLGRERVPDHAWQPVLTVIVTRFLTDLTVKTEFGTLGEGPVVVEADGYEFWRAFFGRRSRAQMESWNWSTPFPVEKATYFPPRATDLVE
ncbi:maleylpyruvate isomerase N-terminal domain-containing protein [Lentzea sp. E54]|uniref:maleylpyruvate isomerase N-terminal domain-containing protein n=1 Tax=Lentzea xerophila TaxID=3435883 RepID=UPI003DA2B32A